MALVATTALAHVAGLDVDTIRSRFGDIPTSLPAFRLPEIDWSRLPALVSPALAIALLAAIESLLSAVVADGLVGGRHRSNAELLGQGLANIASPLFGGFPATGAIARTATNVRNGGRTPIAGMIHALTLVGILLVAVRWASLVPMATLSGILVVVAYNMSEWRAFLRLFRGPRSDVLVLLTTFALTVGIDLTVAIQVGVVLAALLFMRRMAEVTQVKPLRDIVEYETSDAQNGPRPELPPGIEAFEINGSFCFGAARKFTETLLSSQGAPRVVILWMRYVLAMDATGLEALEDVASRFRRRGTTLLLSRCPRTAARRHGAQRSDRADRHGEPVRLVHRRGRPRAAAPRRVGPVERRLTPARFGYPDRSWVHTLHGRRARSARGPSLGRRRLVRMAERDGAVANPGLVRPPWVYLVAVLVGIGLDRVWPLALPLGSTGRPLGAVVGCAGLLVFVAAQRAFRGTGTPVPGNRPATAVVRAGPMRVSRNPIYLALSLMQLGLGLWLDSAWILALLVPPVALMHFVVIPREERYMEAEFGAEYLAYKRSVRRCL